MDRGWMMYGLNLENECIRMNRRIARYKLITISAGQATTKVSNDLSVNETSH